MTCRSLLATVLLGVLTYLATFALVLDKPLTTAVIGDYVAVKESYLAGLATRRKIAIFAGSNGRYSHRCETLTETTGIPCANLSSGAGYDLSWQMARYLPYLGKGDVLYMPLEYWPLLAENSRVGAEAPFVVRHERADLTRYAPAQLGAALFYFDIKYFFSSLGEMLLHSAGMQRRTSVHSMNAQGDERDASAAKAYPYREFLRGLAAPTVLVSAYDDPVASAAVASVVDAARAKGIIVVGGLPTTFEDASVPATVLERLRNLYQARGACFLTLPNQSRYPRTMFFDTAYHLQEAAQIAHSKLLAPYLARIWHSRSCVG